LRQAAQVPVDVNQHHQPERIAGQAVEAVFGAPGLPVVQERPPEPLPPLRRVLEAAGDEILDTLRVHRLDLQAGKVQTGAIVGHPAGDQGAVARGKVVFEETTPGPDTFLILSLVASRHLVEAVGQEPQPPRRKDRREPLVAVPAAVLDLQKVPGSTFPVLAQVDEERERRGGLVQDGSQQGQPQVAQGGGLARAGCAQEDERGKGLAPGGGRIGNLDSDADVVVRGLLPAKQDVVRSPDGAVETEFQGNVEGFLNLGPGQWAAPGSLAFGVLAGAAGKVGRGHQVVGEGLGDSTQPVADLGGRIGGQFVHRLSQRLCLEWADHRLSPAHDDVALPVASQCLVDAGRIGRPQRLANDRQQFRHHLPHQGRRFLGSQAVEVGRRPIAHGPDNLSLSPVAGPIFPHSKSPTEWPRNPFFPQEKSLWPLKNSPQTALLACGAPKTGFLIYHLNSL